MTTPPPSPPSAPPPPLTPRGALILLLTVLAGITVGVLTAAADQDTPLAVIAGLGAAAIAAPLFHTLIGP
jgi:hypothetical protein